MIGWTDLPADLSDRAALHRLSAALPQAPVVSSDLARATTTADALALGRPRLPADRDLREMHFGAWERRLAAEVEAETPEVIRAFWDTPGEVCPPGGESWNALRARTDRAIDRLAALKLPDVIVVAHFGPILTQIQRALGIGGREAFAHRIETLSLTRIDRAGMGWRLHRANHRP